MSAGLAVVTGATGHLGNVLVRALVEQGVRVRAVLQRGDATAPLAGLSVALVEADVCEPETLRPAFEGADVVFHLAGVVSIRVGDEARMERVNVEGTANVVAACVPARVRRLVYVSSVHALNEPAGGVLDEACGFDPARAVGPYARTKATASLVVQQAARSGRLDAVLVLPSGVVGPFDYRLSEVGQLIVALGEGRLRVLLGGGYDFVDVRDVAAGLLAAAARGRRGEAYILGAGRLDMQTLARVVAQVSGRRPALVLPPWVGAPVAALAPAYERLTRRRALVTPYALRTLAVPYTVSHAKASAELGFRPRALTESVADAWRWQVSDPNSPKNRRLRAVGPGRRMSARP